mmetsp:Transcript_24387/g.36589  ORF Transcript_24387/g.36589 Transcript_24387/m.36589 type:complete len:654 (+) Transcript_24387:50-2011(+)
MLRDLATSEKAGQQNALAGFANSIGKQGQRVADAKQFSGMRAPGMQWSPGASVGPQTLNPGMTGSAAEMKAFSQQFNNGPTLMRMQTAPVMPMLPANLNRHMSAPPMNQMINEFKAMNMQNHQTAQFEKAFAPVQQKPKQVSAPSKPIMQSPAVSNAQGMTMYNSPMQMMPMMSMGMPMGMHSMNTMNSMQNQMNVPSANEVESLFQGVQAPKNKFDTKAQTRTAPAPEPVVQETRQRGGMGLDAEMIKKLMTSDNPRWRNSKFLKFLSKVNNGEIEFKDNKVVHKEKPKAAEVDDSKFDMGDAWAAEFESNSQQQEWTNEKEVEAMREWRQQFDQNMRKAMPQQRPQVKPKNPYLKKDFKDNGEAFAKGLRLMKDGNLKEAIQAFEADVTYHPEHAEGWRYLGQCRADEEEEKPAIAALLKALDCDPYNLPALLMLGVSYTNDLEEETALGYLKTWLENNPEYCSLKEVKSLSSSISKYQKQYRGADHLKIDTSLADVVTQMFLAALKQNPKDPELHTVLGVLNHLSDNYEAAIHHFGEGCKLKPSDPYLWNKLGATQANSRKSKMAVSAYHKALALKPNYMRARTNLAIAYANQNMHDKACIHYLKALRQNSEAQHVWGYLKISLARMGRSDLLLHASSKNLDGFTSAFKF